MNNSSFNHIFASIRRITDKSNNRKYVEKIVNTISSRVKRKDKYGSNVVYKNNKNNINVLDEGSLDYDEILESSNVSNDSGIITKEFVPFVDESTIKNDTPQPKKIAFSPEISTIVEVEIPRTEKQPQCYYSTPYKYIARISETPKPQKVEYVATPSPKEEKRKELLTEEVLDAVNIIKETPTPVGLSGIKISNTNFERSHSCRSVDEKFVVNLFESRQSKRWKRQSICVANLQSAVMKNPPQLLTHESHVENHRPTRSERRDDPPELDENEMFQKLKMERNAECVKMNQASNILKAIRKKRKSDLAEELLAERILLETDQKCKLLVNKIHDLNYSDVKTERSGHIATITVSKFQYLLKAQDRKAHNYSEFFVLTLSHGTDFMISKVTTPTNNNLEFSESFTFKNVDSNFSIKAKIFSIKLKAKGRTSTLLKRKARELCPMSKIYYENVNTCEMEESRVLKTSFVECGEMEITKDDIGNTSHVVSNIPEGSRLHSGVTFSITLNDLEVNAKVSGFLTLGLPNKHDNVIFWERKWCVLDKTQFSIYNYPSDEDFGEPVTTINLEYCFAPLQTNVVACSKKRNFLIKTGRPSAINEINNVTLRKRPNFVLEKYFFSADNNEDFRLWSSEINSVLNCLKDWRKLVFVDDYY